MLRDIIFDLDEDISLMLEVEIRQDCLDIIDVLMNCRKVTANAYLIRNAKKIMASSSRALPGF